MRPDLMEILACPLCKGELTLTTTDEQAGEVMTGSLHCARCEQHYPIHGGIPNLLPPDLRDAMEQERAATAEAESPRG